VQGVGNYRFSDFVKVGLPLNIICLILSVIFIPMIWPF
jgi:di/tricarboxylate transporter